MWTTLAVPLAFAVVGIIHLLPIAPAFVPETLSRLYGVAPTDTALLVLMRHRALLLALVILLSLRLRRREMEVLFRLGCSRGLMVRLQLVEWGTLLAASAGLAWMLAKVAASVAAHVGELARGMP